MLLKVLLPYLTIKILRKYTNRYINIPVKAILIFLFIRLKIAINATKANSYSIEGNILDIIIYKNSKTIFVHGLICVFNSPEII